VPRRRANSAGAVGPLALGAALTLLLCLPQVVSSDSNQNFRNAIQLLDARDIKSWQQSIDKLQAALAAAPENGKPVRIYGNRYQNYLPHYYLGLAHYRLGDCQGALADWARSLGVGAVQKTAEFDSLRLYQIDCQKRVPSQVQP
jgi:tetratricopeptide (TPR) repeat protein